MQSADRRILTPTRMVALALIFVFAASLASYRFAPHPWKVAVPARADIGDLSLAPCTYPTEDGDYEADCGTLVVPENRTDPATRMIALPVVRIRAHTPQPGDAVFRLEGGPGGTNMEFGDASRLAADRDVVLVGYRGVDGSSRLDCPEVASALKHSADLLAEESWQAQTDAFGACARRLQSEGYDLAGYTLPQRVDDLEAARVALGYGRIDLVSESAGTRTAMIYSWRHPGSINRSVMIGANPPGHFLWDGRISDEQIRHYAELCAQDSACSSRTDDLAATMGRTAADMPHRWGILPIKSGNVGVGTFYGMHESTSEAAPMTAPLMLDAWLSAAEGDAGGFWVLSMVGGLMLPDGPVWGDIGAASRADAAAAAQHFASGGKAGSILGNPGTDFMWAGGRTLDAWPANPDEARYSRMQTSDVETLVIGGNLDFTTPPEVATRELLPYLPNGHQVVLAELGHTIDFWSYQPEAGTTLVNTFLRTGAVDDSLYTHRTMDFWDGLSFADIARIAVASMALLALAAVASFVWMPLRVRRRGGFGPKAAGVLRSVYPVVLGLGSWSLLVLAGTVVWPAIPLMSETVVVLTVGVSVGLGIYWAWVRRDWSSSTRTAGMVVAVAASVAGALFGYPAGTAALSLLTTILGATLAANLALIVLDMVGARPGPAPVDAPDTGGTPDTAAAPGPTSTTASTSPLPSTARVSAAITQADSWSATPALSSDGSQQVAGVVDDHGGHDRRVRGGTGAAQPHRGPAGRVGAGDVGRERVAQHRRAAGAELRLGLGEQDR